MKEYHRGRAYRRHQRARSIHRKKKLSYRVYGMDWFRGVDGKYSKGHVGCGCWLCKPDKRFRRPSWEHFKKTVKCEQDIKDYYENDILAVNTSIFLLVEKRVEVW